VLVEVTDGRVVGISGDRRHPFSHGYICPKGQACMEIIYHPERLTKPLLRVGTRERGHFEAVTWDRDLDVLADRLLDAREK
jgi:anaerobic selenocysteine-containing dehydrogenase